MKIVWALPEFKEPKTGGEIYYKKLRQSFDQRAEVIHPKGIEYFSGGKNINNLKAMLGFDKKALIIQDLTFVRRGFLLANIILSLFFGRKIVLFVHEVRPTDKILTKLFYGLFFKYAHRIIVNSNSTLRWVNSFGNFKGKIFVFYPVLK